MAAVSERPEAGGGEGSAEPLLAPDTSRRLDVTSSAALAELDLQPPPQAHRPTMLSLPDALPDAVLPEARRPGRPAVVQSRVLAFLEKHPESDPRTISDALGVPYNSVRTALSRLRQRYNNADPPHLVRRALGIPHGPPPAPAGHGARAGELAAEPSSIVAEAADIVGRARAFLARLEAERGALFARIDEIDRAIADVEAAASAGVTVAPFKVGDLVRPPEYDDRIYRVTSCTPTRAAKCGWLVALEHASGPRHFYLPWTRYAADRLVLHLRAELAPRA